MHLAEWAGGHVKGLEHDQPKQEGPPKPAKGAVEPAILQRSLHSNPQTALL